VIRETSIEAYRYLVDEGILPERRRHAYRIIFKYGPATSNQLEEYVVRDNPHVAREVINNIDKRISELRDMGVVRELGTTICPITNREVILWDVTKKKCPSKLEHTDIRKRLWIKPFFNGLPPPDVSEEKQPGWIEYVEVRRK